MWKKLVKALTPVEIRHIPESMGDPSTPLPVIACNIPLERDEFCSLILSAKWGRMEKSRRKYSGAGISVRITKGITLRAGGGQSDPEEVFNTRSAGTLYFTNKRFIFHGSAKSTTIELSEIAQLPLGPDHFQVIRDNLPTEIFTFATHWLNSEKVRALVVRLWLSNAAGDSDEYITSEDSDWVEPDVEDATDALSQQSLEEIEALHGAIASEGVPTEADLSSFENLVNTVLAWDVLLEKKREYPHCLIDSSRSDLITRVFSAHEHRDISADFAKTILARLRASRRLVSPHVADFEIFTQQRQQRQQRRLAWPEVSKFSGTDGAISLLLTKANDFEPYDPSSTIEGGTEWLRKAQGREIIVSLIHESEALSKKHNIASLKDSQVFAYIAVRAAGEDTFAEYIDPDISLELYKSPMFGAAFGIKWLELVDEFVVNMGASIPKEFKTYYNTTRANIRPEIERRVRHRTSPITTYKEMVRVANELWIYLVTQSQTPASLESSVEEDPQAMTNKSISLRLGNLKRLFDNKEITELEYQRQRQRILGDL